MSIVLQKFVIFFRQSILRRPDIFAFKLGLESQACGQSSLTKEPPRFSITDRHSVVPQLCYSFSNTCYLNNVVVEFKIVCCTSLVSNQAAVAAEQLGFTIPNFKSL